MFKKVGTDSRLLKISDVENGGSIDKVCYVSDVKSGVSRLDQGYYTIFVKTSDGVVIPAFIFNIADFIDAGFHLFYLKGKLVQLTGSANVMNKTNSMSIIVKNIKVLKTGEDGITDSMYSDFLGKVEDVEDLFDECSKFFNGKILPSAYKFKSYSEIYNGKVGGYVDLLWQWSLVVGITSERCGVVLKDIFYPVVINYGDFLDRKLTLTSLSVAEILDLINSVDVDNSNEYSLIVKDALSAIYGLSKPEHLYANIIYNSFMHVYKMQEMTNAWNTLPKGGVIESREYTLRKY